MSCHEADRLDRIAYLDSPVHRLDPRAKIVAVLAFTVAVVSFPKYELFGLAPYLFLPLVMVTAGGVPAGLVARRIALVSPFAIMIGLFNPLLDRAPAMLVGGYAVPGGWLSFASILARFALTLGALLALAATTSFPAICQGLTALRVPRAFVVQLLFLYRYLFLLAEEAGRMRRARELRALGRRGLTLRSAGALAGSLFVRTLDRAERIHQAMSARGYDGTVRQLRALDFRAVDAAFAVLAAGGAILLRIYPVTYAVGRWSIGP